MTVVHKVHVIQAEARQNHQEPQRIPVLQTNTILSDENQL